jgi:hypothetical protein
LQADVAAGDSNPFMNLLLVPYPFNVGRDWFQAARSQRCGRSTLPDEFGFFRFKSPPADNWITKDFRQILDEARSVEKDIHGVVFPEASFTSPEEFRSAYSFVRQVFPDAFLLAGVCVQNPHDADGLCRNVLNYAVPLSDDTVCLFEQSKHHRWKLDASQLDRYRISTLNRGKWWWEHIDISDRRVHFFSVRNWLTFCFLICEDLARQEPVAPVVRAIGPHLVVALLLDGPQLSARWPGRYASVLAEDPGSAVLTLTSLGMAKASSSPRSASVSVGLWRDKKETRELRLRGANGALLLKLHTERQTEHSADGRRNSHAADLFVSKVLQI